MLVISRWLSVTHLKGEIPGVWVGDGAASVVDFVDVDDCPSDAEVANAHTA